MKVLDDINVLHTDLVEKGVRRITIQHVIIAELREVEDQRLLKLHVLQALHATAKRLIIDANNLHKEIT